ncbi:tyrosine-type recombinase/integrase [Dongia rigui]|uniref:Integrase family protein n=1 Tax=Dongia rigui TaxID=940149 RepID=A0ABU5E044_9PROT|nr:integrase family protein [Dongia rigui]MDY0872833.1 integrase family protein [Dongia rigui]
MPRVSFAPLKLRALKAPAPSPTGAVVQVDYFDETNPGFGLRYSSNGVASWFYLARVARGGRKLAARFTIGRAALSKDEGGMSLSDARAHAAELRKAIDRGEDPKETADAVNRRTAKRRAATFDTVSADFLRLYPLKAKIGPRHLKETGRIFRVYCSPEWGKLPIADIKRSDVVALLDDVTENNGAIMADRVLAAVRKLFNWYAAREDEFNSPIVRDMASGHRSERKRVLEADELRQIWTQLDEPQLLALGPGIKLLLLTAQRRNNVFAMRWKDLDLESAGGPLWTIPAEDHKTGAKTGEPLVMPLSSAAAAIIKAQRDKRIGKCPYVFSTDGETHFQAFSQKKATLDNLIQGARLKADRSAAPLPGWTLHDCRRTAKTMMRAVGVDRFTSERCLGHVIPGVEGIYDRHAYVTEMRDAFERLSTAIKTTLESVPAKSALPLASTFDSATLPH